MWGLVIVVGVLGIFGLSFLLLIVNIRRCKINYLSLLYLAVGVILFVYETNNFECGKFSSIGSFLSVIIVLILASIIYGFYHLIKDRKMYWVWSNYMIIWPIFIFLGYLILSTILLNSIGYCSTDPIPR